MIFYNKNKQTILDSNECPHTGAFDFAYIEDGWTMLYTPEQIEEIKENLIKNLISKANYQIMNREGEFCDIDYSHVIKWLHLMCKNK